MGTSNNPAHLRKLSAHSAGAKHPKLVHGLRLVVNPGSSPYLVRFVEPAVPGGPRKARFIDLETGRPVLRLNGPSHASWPDVAVLHELLRLTDPHADMGDLPHLSKVTWLVNVTPSGFTLGLDATGLTPWSWRLPLSSDTAHAERVAKKLMRAMADPAGPDASILAQAMNS